MTRGATQGAAQARGPKPHTSAPSDPHSKRGGKTQAEAPGTRVPTPPQAQLQPARHDQPRFESLEQVSNQRRPTGNEMRDQEMPEPLESPIHRKERAQLNAEHLMGGGSTPSAKLLFELSDLTGSRAKTTEAYANPFASPSESCKEAGLAIRAQGEAMEGWTFQGRRRHTPKLASPRHEALQPPPAPHNGRPPREAKGGSHT